MKRVALALLALLMALAASAAAEGEITSKAQLDRPGVRIGVGTGSAAMLMVEQELPNAELVYLEAGEGFEAVALGKIDAYVYDRRQMELAIESGRRGVHLLDEDMEGVVPIAAGISPASKIPDLEQSVNAFIAQIKADGTLDDMYRRWVTDGDLTMPDIDMPSDPRLHLVVGTTGIVPPFSYYVGDALSGYDIEMAYRFAAYINADVTFKVYDYGSIIIAAATGDVDLILANLNVTPERAEVLTFSDPFYELPVAIMVKGDPKPDAASDGGKSLDRLNGARIGIQTGTSYTDTVLERLPDAQISYFNTYTDMVAALETYKIDAFPGDEPVMKMMVAEDDRLELLEEPLESVDMGFVLPKSETGEKLQGELNEWIAAMKADGRMDALFEKWVDGPESGKTMPDYEALPAPNGTLRFATEAAYAPMNYLRDGKIVGLEVEMAALFCEAYGYGMTVQAMNFDGLLPAVKSGKADFVAASIAITEERAESVNFSDPYFNAGTVLAVLKGGEGAAATEKAADETGALGGVADSFQKTFVREGRWQLFARGVVTTLVITLLSILFGTLLGFAVFMLCRNGNPIANGVTRFSMWLVQGMPMVVLLMILYYIIFGSVAISGIAVAVVGFTLTFGAAVFGLLKMGVGAVDGGQYEAAYALGYSNRRTFFRIILPQALPHVLSAYRGEVVGLIKATAIVGYIAVQDLTKMGDIVRSRTYEAFFPLIAVTVIYFLLEGLIGFMVSRFTININPRRRKPEDILKGVKTDDQD